MTSPSRRKRPTTRPSSPTGNSRAASFEPRASFPTRSSRRAPRTLAPLLCALLVLSHGTAAHAETTRLQWGNPSNPFRKPSASSGSDLKFVKPLHVTARNEGAAIRLAAFSEEDAPRLTSARDDSSSRSLVVHRNESAAEGFHAAQLPSSAPSAGSQSDDLFRAPFDGPGEPAQIETPPAATSGAATQPMGEAGSTLPPPDGGAREPNNNFLRLEEGGQPGFPGRQQPVDGRATPDASTGTQLETGQFQPILPAGPGPDQSPPTPITPQQDAKIREEGERARESCEESLKNLRAYTVDKVSLNIMITGTEGEDYPFECAIDDGAMFGGRSWDQITYMWKASALCHKPLYFEDEQLERYGHSFTPCLQPFVSGAHFFTRPFVLPYCMGVEPPCECIYALGHYRPGNCAPYMCNPVPLSFRGAVFQAGAVTGAAAILP